ncbi:hypothetical protein BAUCODRAFT_39160 [Baudoinia panamericana UAMH 10762]|uniref:Uncharacterized protein n=1 Tax=Baudoinia panamericana (strain UAMH 10762) TaxID=717646 RepID=M2N0B6_BAUPA|nr:uncharacterized protein BAUCODRAFT_39160 [Baudoinia panamericana UAMH 10762]EMC92010.1 hypothetical protein BAUCODRAFT_39160 [Baudoinia panamericana UAMH 10762]
MEELLCHIELIAGIASKGLAKPRLALLDLQHRMNAAYAESRQSANVGTAGTFFETWQDGDAESVPVQARIFVDFHRDVVLTVATRDEFEYVQLRGNVGLSHQGYRRCQDHVRLEDSSPTFFRLVHLVMMALWPDAGWHLSQVILFTITKVSQAEIGETIGSLMCGGYGGVGGMNFAQPAINLGGIDTMTYHDWSEANGRAVTSEWLRRVQPNLESEMQRRQSDIDEMSRQIRAFERAEKLAELGAVYSEHIELLAESDKELRAATAKLDVGLAESQRTLEAAERRAAQEKEAREVIDRVNRWAAAMDPLPPVPEDASPEVRAAMAAALDFDSDFEKLGRPDGGS